MNLMRLLYDKCGGNIQNAYGIISTQLPTWIKVLEPTAGKQLYIINLILQTGKIGHDGIMFVSWDRTGDLVPGANEIILYNLETGNHIQPWVFDWSDCPVTDQADSDIIMSCQSSTYPFAYNITYLEI